MQKNNSQLSSIILSAIALLILVLCSLLLFLKLDLNVYIQGSLVILIATLLPLLIVAHLSDIKKLVIRNKIKYGDTESTQELGVETTDLAKNFEKAESVNIDGNSTVASFDMTNIKTENFSNKALALWIKVMTIISEGINPINCNRALNLIRKNPKLVQDNWVFILIEARCLRVLGNENEAKTKAILVKQKFSRNYKAVGSAIQVILWIHLLNEPQNVNNDSYKIWLSKAIDLVEEGLSYYFECHALQFNAFCIYSRCKDKEKTLKALQNMIAIKESITALKLIELREDSKKKYLIKIARKLSLENRMIIDKLTGENSVKELIDTLISINLIMKLMLIFTFFIGALLLFNIGSQNLTNQFLSYDGTDFGRSFISYDGTDFGLTSFDYDGTDFGKIC